MTRGKQPGHIEVTSRRTLVVNHRGDFVTYLPPPPSSDPMWKRHLRADTREQVL